MVGEASKRLFRHTSTGVELWRELVEETAEEPRLPGAHETSDDGHEVPHVQTAELQCLVYDLLGSLVTQRSWEENIRLLIGGVPK